MTNQFHFQRTNQSTIIKKYIFSFLYSHSSFFDQHRIQRYQNRSYIFTVQPYSVRIELYQRNQQEQLNFIGLWQYPIHFDYLPVFHLNKILRLNDLSLFNISNPCLSNPCYYPNEQCHQLINDPKKFICLCQTNFTGENCLIKDQQCTNGYCSTKALCKPNYRSLLKGNTFPFCICSFDRYGDRCEIQHDICQFNRCLNNGICVPESTHKIFCLCTEFFFGDRCQWKKSSFHLILESQIYFQGVVIQYFDIDFISFDLIFLHQQVYEILPSSLQYQHHQNQMPAIVLARLYTSFHISPNLYLLSLHIQSVSIDGKTFISQDNQCSHIQQLS
ncbi:unnamed protein product [Rotaria magnacalcarata]|uniref:EGF-like domain-containing protein n=1 Tax=Rotaria magnacalcarata TaxID=392030 RepID=A0A819UWI2_9BILA|nr:unnamed protein product [Rotaria magnacalcarata]CAF2159473.1 unnamed protein product [Rotaria magnacalcarata]CAF3890509.1 unnamed protein product [Rotaria magnacalcarata]CAF4099415.1 unnamed protein product [Rotaria magnacalcarata]